MRSARGPSLASPRGVSIAATLAFWFAATSSVLSAAAPVRTPLAADAVTLAGPRPSHELIVATPAEAAIAIELRWRGAAELDLDRSSLVVTVDEIPIASARLRGGAALTATTSVASAGFHRVVIVAHLFVIGETCPALDRDRAWLVLERDSAIIAPGDGATLASIITGWRAKPDAPLSIAFATATEPAPPSEIATYLEADATARSWSRRLTEVAVDASPALRIAWGQLVDDDAVAIIAATEDGLDISAVDAAGARAALTALRDPRFVEACRALPCRVAGRAGAEEVPSEHAAPGFTLAELGFTDGVVLRGVGAHHQRWSWQRPAVIQPRAWPSLHLLITVPRGRGVVGARSSVTIEVNHRPIGSFDLAGATDGQVHVAARVPTSLWTASRWQFDVSVMLRAAAEEPCSSELDATTWVVLEPGSGLTVPALEARYGGLADLSAIPTGIRPPLLLDGPLPRRVLSALAAAAAPFALATPEVDWQLVERCAAPVCLTTTGTEVERVDRLALVAAAGVPLPATGDALAIRRRAGEAGASDLIDVMLPRGGARWWPTPDYAQLIGAAAVAVDDRWYPVRIAARPTSTVARAATTPDSWPRAATSHELRRRLVRDLMWAAVVIVILLALGYAFRRNNRARRRRPSE